MEVNETDFIVVGGGPSGLSLATRLASAPSKPSVLVVEAGGTNDDLANRVAGERNTFWMTPKGMQLDHGYKTVPQQALNGRELPYHRGKGLGGSTATNLGVWDYGSCTEHDEWARLVDDDRWKWENVKGRYQELANLRDLTPHQFKHFVQPHERAFAHQGPVDVTFPNTWDPCLPSVLEAAQTYGLELCPDLSSDHSLGIGLAPATICGDHRVTAHSAYLSNRTGNLYVLTESPAQRIVFAERRARAVEIIGGQRHYASKEIILSAGAIDTPKLLLLSGVGAASELARHQIPLILDNPSIGSHLQDHPIIRIGANVKGDEFKARPLPSSAQDIAAAAQGYLKVDLSRIPAIETLSEEKQALLRDKQTPTHELLLRIVKTPPDQHRLMWIAAIVMMNPQSRGGVSLRSKDPQDPPLIDLDFLSHPFDIQVIVEAIKSTAPLLLQSSIIPTEGFALGPKSMETSDIEEFIRANLTHLWHACGTVRMGKAGAEGTCVTPDFKVEHLEGLRVADLSIAPIIPSNHPQSTAYLIGALAAQDIIAEHSL